MMGEEEGKMSARGQGAAREAINLMAVEVVVMAAMGAGIPNKVHDHFFVFYVLKVDISK